MGSVKTGITTVLGMASIAVLWAGCTATRPTEVVPGVISQIQVPKHLKGVRIDISIPGSPSPGPIVARVDDGVARLPSTLGVVGERAKTVPITVLVTGWGDVNDFAFEDPAIPVTDRQYHKDVKILRRARFQYRDEKILYLPMPLRYSCYEAQPCGLEETCVAGECKPVNTIDPNTMVEYSDDLVKGTSSTCFSPKTCMATAVQAFVDDPDNCIYALPAAPPPGINGMNVKVTYDNYETEILDLDAEEGFIREGLDKIRLAPGLCKIAKNAGAGRRIVNVELSPLCAPKTIYQPICFPEQPAAGTICNIERPLEPSPSALYVAMDQSSSMGEIFGETAIKTVLGLSLNDPVFSRTFVAFKFFPHQPADCNVADNSLSQSNLLEVPFALAPLTQKKVTSFVGNKANVLGSDPNLFVDALYAQNTGGAVKAIETFRAGRNFNKRAVMIIANRTLKVDDCGGNLASITQAVGNANAAGVQTYVVLLGHQTTTPDAAGWTAVATAGGTTLFDVRTQPEVGGEALATVATDLGACLYEPLAPQELKTNAKISYKNPTAGNAESFIPFNAACNKNTAQAVNGWNIDGGQMRICGEPCTTYKNVLKLARGTKVPIMANQPCE
jgi:hypothetical protein